MPDRGQMYVPVMNVDVETGVAEEDVVWIPFHSADEPVIVPDVLLDDGPRVRRLRTVKAYGPDLVCEQYAYLGTYVVVTSRKRFVLGPEDSVADVVAQVGGRGFYQVDAMQLVGDLVETDAGPAYLTLPCFRTRLPLEPDGSPVFPPGNAIGWCVFHVDERAERLDVDWQRPETAARWCPVPELDVRLDRATAGSGSNLYAPVLDREGDAQGVHVLSRGAGGAPAAAAGATVEPPTAPAPRTSPPAARAGGVTVLPEAPRRRRLFGR